MRPHHYNRKRGGSVLSGCSLPISGWQLGIGKCDEIFCVKITVLHINSLAIRTTPVFHGVHTACNIWQAFTSFYTLFEHDGHNFENLIYFNKVYDFWGASGYRMACMDMCQRYCVQVNRKIKRTD